jgi:hypothetical protein
MKHLLLGNDSAKTHFLRKFDEMEIKLKNIPIFFQKKISGY